MLRNCVACGLGSVSALGGLGADIVGVGPDLPVSSTPQPGMVAAPASTVLSILQGLTKGYMDIKQQDQALKLQALAAKGKNAYLDPRLLKQGQGGGTDWGNIALIGLGVAAAGGLLIALMRRR